MKPAPIDLYVEPCAASFAVGLALLGPVRPPCGWQGGKGGYTGPVLEGLGLAPGQGAREVWIADCTGWGNTWRVLSAGAEACEQVARFLELWCADERQDQTFARLAAEWRADGTPPEPRAVARWIILTDMSFQGKGPQAGFQGFYKGKNAGTMPATQTAPKIRAIGDLAWPVVRVFDDARELPPMPSGRVVVYLDPPYAKTTGYGKGDLGRADVVDLARLWQDQGAIVGVSEGEPIGELHGVELDLTARRRGQKRTNTVSAAEWLTVIGRGDNMGRAKGSGAGATAKGGKAADVGGEAGELEREAAPAGAGEAEVGDLGAWVDVRELTPWSGNYNEHPRAQLDALHESIDTFGWTNPIVVHRESLRVVGGHGRLAVALEKIERVPGWRLADAPGPGQVPVRWFRGTWDQAEALAVADNEIARLARPDAKRLGIILAGVAARRADTDRAVLAMGLTRPRVADLLLAARPKDPKSVPVPGPIKTPKRPQSVPGEVYQLGVHRLRCGDSMDVEGLRVLLNGQPADLTFTDPPFAIYGSATGIGRDMSDDGMILAFFEDVLRHASSATRMFGLVWVCCDWRSYPAWHTVARATDLTIKNVIVWDKGGCGLGNQYAQTYEMMVFLVKQPAAKAMKNAGETGMRAVLAPNLFHLFDAEPDARPVEADPGTVYGDPGDGTGDERSTGPIVQAGRVAGAERVHNAQKPISLVEAILKPAARPGEVVLDLFAGSGTTMFAAERLGLAARLCERSPAWCDVIRTRWGTWARDLGIDPGPGAL